MDPQFAPRIIARRTHLQIVDAIAAVGNETNVAVFQRFAVMRHWITSGQYQLADITTSDGLHMNNLSYGCMAHLLAGSLVKAAESGAENRRRVDRTKAAIR